ncbi:MAG: hypothetical protein IPI46_00340 [Bacteroidetes bacterium]|nr:hypothetical protein [Bacteroidota bacterium]
MKTILIFCFLLGITNQVFAQKINFNVNKNELQNSGQSYMYTNLKSQQSFRPYGNNYPEDDEMGQNIIGIRLMGILVRDWRDRVDTAVAISYERILGSGRFSIRTPLEIGLHSKSFFISPTLKMYAGRQGVVRYAIGPQLTLGAGMHNHWIEDPKLGYVAKQVRRTQVGLMLNQSVNITIAKQFYVGVDLGLGAMVYNSIKNDNDAAVLGVILFGPIGFLGFVSPSVQGGLSLGYRF